jgi:hypothetical protein
MPSSHILSFPKTQLTIRAELSGDDTASACGIVAQDSSPVLTLCRKLVEAGHDPDQPLEAWRASTFCVRVRAIGEAAKLAVNAKGTGFLKAIPAVRTASPSDSPPAGSPR